MRKTVILLVAGILLISSLLVPVNAATDTTVTPLWENTMEVSGNIVFDGTTGTYSMWIEGDPGVSKITATATLYRKNGAGEWIEIPTDWSYIEYSDSLFIGEDFTAVSGWTYKVTLSTTVYKNGVGETITRTITATCP